jgi:hypothetical protein
MILAGLFPQWLSGETIPMIVFTLPRLFVVLIGPATIQVLAVMHK